MTTEVIMFAEKGRKTTGLSTRIKPKDLPTHLRAAYFDGARVFVALLNSEWDFGNLKSYRETFRIPDNYELEVIQLSDLGKKKEIFLDLT